MSGLVAPPWGLILLLTLWVAMSVVLVKAFRRGNLWLALAVPLAGAALWFAVVQGLRTLFDWTA